MRRRVPSCAHRQGIRKTCGKIVGMGGNAFDERCQGGREAARRGMFETRARNIGAVVCLRERGPGQVAKECLLARRPRAEPEAQEETGREIIA